MAIQSASSNSKSKDVSKPSKDRTGSPPTASASDGLNRTYNVPPKEKEHSVNENLSKTVDSGKPPNTPKDAFTTEKSEKRPIHMLLTKHTDGKAQRNYETLLQKYTQLYKGHDIRHSWDDATNIDDITKDQKTKALDLFKYLKHMWEDRTKYGTSETRLREAFSEFIILTSFMENRKKVDIHEQSPYLKRASGNPLHKVLTKMSKSPRDIEFKQYSVLLKDVDNFKINFPDKHRDLKIFMEDPEEYPDSPCQELYDTLRQLKRTDPLYKEAWKEYFYLVTSGQQYVLAKNIGQLIETVYKKDIDSMVIPRKSYEDPQNELLEKIKQINELTSRINDISKECANLHKDKESTALLVEKLSKTVEDREAKIHSLEAERSRFEEQISRLSVEIKTLHSSKGRAADENMQGLLKENYSMKTALAKATSNRFMDVAPRRKHRLFVASIDFGTTYSGYAFSSKDEWKRNPLKIHTNVWNSGTKTSAKTPTTLLLGPKREFLAFGYDAETRYSESEGNFASYYYFYCFKLILQGNDNFNCNTSIRDATGKTLDALTVFSISIKYITDHLFKSLSDKFLDIEMDDIHFVLTVPAIWDDKAKQFMTEAAVRAGIPNEQLSIAMEQEMAAIYCGEDCISQDNDRVSSLKEGMTFMVVDLGGGTTDITFHRSSDNGKFDEIWPPTGGPWGGQNVNEAFFGFIAELFGQSVIDELKKRHMDDYLDLERHFEIKKRSVASNKTGIIKINFPLSVFELANEMNENKSVCDIINQNSKYAGRIKAETQKLQIPIEILISLFRPTIGKIIEHIHTILKENTNEVDVILMVGGFAECDIVQNEFKKNFSDKKIIVPEEAGLAVLKGAVLYGHMQ